MPYVAPRRRKKAAVLECLIKRHGLERVVEIGVGRGDTARHLLSYCPRVQYLGVDNFGPGFPEGVAVPPHRYGSSDDTGARGWPGQRVNREIAVRVLRAYSDRACIREMTAAEAVERVDDGSLDLVFIDADMRPVAVEENVRNWLPKLSERGWLTGAGRDIPAVAKLLASLLPTFRKHEDGVWTIPAEEARTHLRETDGIGPEDIHPSSIPAETSQPPRRKPGRPRKMAA